MNFLNSYDFPLDWVLLNKLCLVRAPRTKSHIEKLKNAIVKAFEMSEKDIKSIMLNNFSLVRTKYTPNHYLS